MKEVYTVIESPYLPYGPRVERLENPPANPMFRAVYGKQKTDWTRDDVTVFEQHGLDLRHAAELDSRLENGGPHDN